MKIVKQIPVVLLGLVFVVFGLDFFIHFMPKQEPKMTADAGAFAGLLFSTGYLKVIKILEITFGALLLIPRTKALGLILIAPICIGILMFEIFMAHEPSIGVALVVLNAIGIFIYKEKYLPIIN
jgi:hypothetical protein